MTTSILIALAVLIGIILILALRKPAQFRYARSLDIAAAPADIFPHVDVHLNWAAWSPWMKLDPNAVATFTGPARGVGAATHWDGNKNLGAGSMTTIESREPNLIKFRMDFLRPMKSTCTADFTFVPNGTGTTVTWSMYGPNTFMGKVFSVFVNCDGMVGDKFAEGLATLKRVVEAQPG